MASSGATKEDDYLRAIGKITVAMSGLEHEMAFVIGVLISDDLRLGERITAGEPFSNLSNLMAVLFHYRVGDMAANMKFRELLGRMHSACEDRNNVVHGDWIFDEAPTYHMPSRFKVSKKRSSFKISADSQELPDLLEIADRLPALTWKLHMVGVRNILVIRQKQEEVAAVKMNPELANTGGKRSLDGSWAELAPGT